MRHPDVPGLHNLRTDDIERLTGHPAQRRRSRGQHDRVPRGDPHDTEPGSQFSDQRIHASDRTGP